MRVIGDKINTDYEWAQARIRARGNEGGTADVYTKFSQDTEFIMIGARVRNGRYQILKHTVPSGES